MIIVRLPDNSLSRLEIGDRFVIRWNSAQEPCYVIGLKEPQGMALGNGLVYLIAESGFFRVQALDVIKTEDRSLETMTEALRLCFRELTRLDP